jgi:hypothetical protein
MKLVHNALSKRLAEVRVRANDLPALPIPGRDEDDQEKKEKILGDIMVRLLPKIKEGRETKDEREKVFALLVQIVRDSSTEDWRFLDSWNNAYETIISCKWPESELKEHVVPFLRYYRSILESWLEKVPFEST